MSNPTTFPNLDGEGSTNLVLKHGRINYIFDGTNAYPQGTKTIQTEPLAAQSAAASTLTTSSPITIPNGTNIATFYFNLGRGNTTAVAGTGTEFRVEVSAKTSGNDSWMAVTSWWAATAAAMSCAASASGTSAAIGGTLLTITSGTAGVVGDNLCFTTGTIEWGRVAAITGTASITMQDGFTFAHTAATGIFGGASNTSVIVDVRGIVRTRVVVNNNYPTTSQPIFFRAACVCGM